MPVPLYTDMHVPRGVAPGGTSSHPIPETLWPVKGGVAVFLDYTVVVSGGG